MNIPSRWFNGLAAAFIGAMIFLAPSVVSAQPFGESAFDCTDQNNCIFEGLTHASGITGLAQGSIRGTILRIVATILTYLALLAVIMIIAAGIYLIFGFGNEEVKERVKRVLIYTVVGLIIVAVSRIIVAFVILVLERA